MFRFAIDRGGTFTDVFAQTPGGAFVCLKLLSVDPAYPDAPREGIRRIIEQVCVLWFQSGLQCVCVCVCVCV